MFVDRITTDPGRMNGLPCIRDLRVTVATGLGQLAAGQTRDQILTDYPCLDVHDITAALELGPTRAEQKSRALRLAEPSGEVPPIR